MDILRKFAGALAGGAAGSLLSIALPALASHAGLRGGSPRDCAWILLPAGFLLGYLAHRLLRWAEGDRCRPTTVLLGAILPWTLSIFAFAGLVLPLQGAEVGGASIGLAKYLLALIWIAFVAILGAFLLILVGAEAATRRLAAALFTVVLLLSFHLAMQPPMESDENDYVAAALAIWTTGSTRVDLAAAEGVMEVFYFSKIPASWSLYDYILKHLPEPMYRYSLRMIAYPLLLAPFAALGLLAQTPAVRWLIASIPMIGMYLVLIIPLLRLVKTPSGRRLTTVIAAGLMTPYLYFPTNLQPEMGMAAATAWMILLWKERAIVPWWAPAFAAAAMGSMLFHERMLLVAGPALAYALLFDRRRGSLLGWCAVLAIPVLISYAATQQYHLPRAMPHAYGEQDVRIFDLVRWTEALMQHLFSVRIGLLNHLPPLLLLPLALRTWKEESWAAGTLRFSGVVFLCYFAVMLTYPHTFDSWPHLRYMVPVLPCLAPWLAAAIDRAASLPQGLAAAQILTALQFLRAVPFLTAPLLWRWFI